MGSVSYGVRVKGQSKLVVMRLVRMRTNKNQAKLSDKNETKMRTHTK